PNSFIRAFSGEGNLIATGFTDEQGFASLQVFQFLKEGETVTVQVVDKNQNTSETLIEVPNFAYIPHVERITQEGLISGVAEDNSTVIVRDADGNELGKVTLGDDNSWSDFSHFSLSVNRPLIDGEKISVQIIDNKGLMSPEQNIIVDLTPPPAPTELNFNDAGDLVYGYAEPFSEILVKDGQGNILNKWFWNNWTDESGSFSIELGTFLTNAETVYVTARDVDLGGHDKIISSVNYSLVGLYQTVNDPTTVDSFLESGRYVEDLELVGSAHLNATGNALDNLLTGNSGNNVLNGREGNDTYITNEGTDTILFQLLNSQDATGGNGHDTVLDFTLGDIRTNLQADKIDLSELLIDYSKDVSALAKFITVEQDAGNTTISLDRDGEGTMFNSVSLLTLNQVNTTLDELLNNQQIIV
ncbi:TPA: Ig-like domain-containing protein, partial [Acinetobacter baumannii]